MASRLEIQNLNRDLNNFVIEGNFYTTSPGWGGGGEVMKLKISFCLSLFSS